MSSQYQILELLGQGQFGRVFKAIYIPNDSLVALKELEKKRFSTRNFLREINFLTQLKHPNIVAFQAIEHNEKGRYLVLDYWDGGNLRHFMQSNNIISSIQSLKIIADVLAGLEYAHTRGIVHCDIKPENILLHQSETGWTACLADFGIALSQDCTEINLGSPAYMAPEQFYGQFLPTSDLYAVGVVLYEMLLGYRPFSGSPGELMSAHLAQPIEIPNTIPLLLRSILSTALQKLPVRRFASATEMLKSIQLALIVEQSSVNTEKSQQIFNIKEIIS
ncbi:serine/threonine protein kinase [Chroogloeocystis siderophila]|uniref:Serine/threonine protein kinase n=1 Tax=Chroogloeocystis siderophila 5.2 s.c.1 TaxID=247279 RepID=A0A1U7HU39_9CHRO|nr:serine/threonine-protein kinase [Chroogloeocystis siderophila]OKH27097.1 serine/threonine protein kinase [Chroogloeocystis siderophila 5.2 s.c.1]